MQTHTSQCRPMKAGNSQRRSAKAKKANKSQCRSGRAHNSQRRLTTANAGQQNQRKPTQASAQAKVHRFLFSFSIVFVYQLNVDPKQPTKSRNSQRRPTTTNVGQ